MAKKASIIGLHAEVTARAAQFINEYARADSESKRRNGSIRAELTRTRQHILKEFSASKIAKGLLSGLGIGGGVEIARRGIDAIVDHFREGAEHAKKMGEYVDKMRQDLRDIAALRFDNFIGRMPDGMEKASVIEQRMTEVRRQRDAAMRERENAREAVSAGGFNMITEWAMAKYGRTTAGSVMKQAQVEIDRQQDIVDGLEKQLDELDAKRGRTIEEGAKKRAEAMSRWLKPFNDKIEAENKRMEAAAERLRDAIATPAEKLAEMLKDLPALLERGLKGLPGGITYDQGRRAMSRAWRQYEEDSDPSKNDYYQRLEKAAGGLRIDDLTRRGLGSGANYQDVARQTNSILVEIRELIRRAINNPRPATYG